MTPEQRAERDEVFAIADAMAEKARREGPKTKTPYLRRGESSLHDLIRTKEQAERFMRALRIAEWEAGYGPFPFIQKDLRQSSADSQ